MTEEVRDVLKRGTVKVILQDEFPNGVSAWTALFLLAIKSDAERMIKLKATYVIGGHRDKLKYYVVHGAQTFQAS